MSNTAKIILGVGVVALVTGGVYLQFMQRGTPLPGGDTPGTGATTTPNGSQGGSSQQGGGTSGGTSGGVGQGGSVDITTPDYRKPINFAPSVEASVRAQINVSLAKVQAELDQNKLNFNSWIKLGTYRKMGGDYAGAAEAWEFVAASVETNNTTPYFNLGDLYMNFIKDYVKAETNFLKVVSLNSKVVDAYVNLYYLYRDLLKNEVKANAIVEQGLQMNPGDPRLLDLKS